MPAGACANCTFSVEITVGTHGKSISPDLFGIFFEDLSYAADGGLYAELFRIDPSNTPRQMPRVGIV